MGGRSIFPCGHCGDDTMDGVATACRKCRVDICANCYGKPCSRKPHPVSDLFAQGVLAAAAKLDPHIVKLEQAIALERQKHGAVNKAGNAVRSLERLTSIKADILSLNRGSTA